MRVDPFFKLSLPGALNDIAGRENKLTQQLSSGLRVSSASDDPTAAAQSVRLGSAIQADDAYTSASNSVQSRLQVADSALGTVVSQITAAIALAVKGSNGTLDAGNLQTISQQLAGLRDQIVSLANTSYAGNYLFSGTATDTKPFDIDASTTPATASYSGDTSQQYLATPGGQRVSVSVPGSAIFSAAGADVLGSLNQLISDFASGTASSTTADALAELRDGLTNVTTQRGTLDASLSTLLQTSTYVASDEANLKAAQSALVATDSAQVATDLSTTETQQKALLSVMSLIGKATLFDYTQ